MSARTFVAFGVAALLFSACFGDSKPNLSPTPEPQPTAEPTPTPVPCPVDPVVCDFARDLERAARDESLPTWIGGPEAASAARRALDGWAATGQKPRVTTVGCPGRGYVQCAEEFAVTLSSLPEGLEEQDGRGLVVFFFDHGEAAPSLRATYEPPGARSLVVAGGQRAFCEPVIAPAGGCVEYEFAAWSTGAPEPASPASPRAPELREVYGATSYEIKLGDPYVIQPGELWYFNYLCDACGPGPFPGLYRAYRDVAGHLVIDDLKARTLSLGNPVAFTADWQRGVAYLATCTEGNCYSLESGDSESDLPAKVYQTRDGGITWQEHGGIPPVTALLGVLGEQVLAADYSAGFAEGRYWFYPSGQELQRPSRISEQVYPVVTNNTVLWRSQRGGYYDGAGTRLFGPIFDEGYSIQLVAADPGYQHTYITWAERPESPTSWTQSPYYTYVGRIDRDGQLRELYGLAGDTMWISGEFPRAGDKPPALFGRFRFGTSVDYARDVSWGAVLDLSDGELHRVAELDGGRREGQFTWLQDLVALRHESTEKLTYLRVTGTGDCLNIRQAPSLTAPVVTCLPDDVLVGEQGRSQLVDGRTWVLVSTLDGGGGWAAVEFLR